MKILELKNITYRADNTDILRGISLDIDAGECVSIVGASGSGKSTLLKLCSDLIPLGSGEILYRGKSYNNYNSLELRRKISYCVQATYLFGETVYDNLEFPFVVREEQVDKDRIIHLLKRFNLDENFLNKDINSLSGGEKQRVSLIRNLVYIPDVLLLDEATSALDRDNAKVVEDIVKELNNTGVTVIWITHSLEQSENIFTRRIIMEDGKVIKEEAV